MQPFSRKMMKGTTYNMIYLDGATGVSYAKRFNVTGITRDKEYDLTKGHEKSACIISPPIPMGKRKW
jgi:hypothetical protein